MKDEPLTLLNIMDIDIPNAKFVFLSACHTAIGDKETPDEGFKSVIGMLWEGHNTVAKHVVEALYESLFKDLKDGGVMDCTKTAFALNCATHTVKTKVPLEQRMAFIHIRHCAGGTCQEGVLSIESTTSTLLLSTTVVRED
ncbi:hypothetical protein EDB19DRAFT_1837154 [Suillus lakei]|nr:hypothetical protein EDB19DRAFT_1837154 [Suillus lakei]